VVSECDLEMDETRRTTEFNGPYSGSGAKVKSTFDIRRFKRCKVQSIMHGNFAHEMLKVSMVSACEKLQER
jgi:hypothetical protein